jgi:ubiquinone/menaquinone biosynthesis C-methylase UbiE
MKWDEESLALLRCPASGERLHQEDAALVTQSGRNTYRINPSGIPLFAEQDCSAEGRAQQQHYDRVAPTYLRNLTYPHTQEYTLYLDQALLEQVGRAKLGTVAEICCGRGEAFHLLGDRIERGIGIDVSAGILEAAARETARASVLFVQGDATRLPLTSEGFDNVIVLGGIHHVNERARLFGEIFRILKPGGRFYWREPVSDFLPWRALRAVVYRMSPALDRATEHPLLSRETTPQLTEAGFRLTSWKTYGFLGFCFLMNSDVLIFNRAFRFVPGIRGLTRLMTRVDRMTLALPGMSRAGLQVVGVAEKPGTSR